MTIMMRKQKESLRVCARGVYKTNLTVVSSQIKGVKTEGQSLGYSLGRRHPKDELQTTSM